MTPLERAAEAVRNELGDYAIDDMWMTEGGLRSAEHYRDIVRAILTSIREPTSLMLGAGRVVLLEGERKTVEAYQAMIDAMLEER